MGGSSPPAPPPWLRYCTDLKIKKNFRIPQVVFKLLQFEILATGKKILLPSFENSAVILFRERSDA